MPSDASGNGGSGGAISSDAGGTGGSGGSGGTGGSGGSDGTGGTSSSCETCGGSSCVDLQTDVMHCGACDRMCPVNASCVEGECVCPDGLTACGAECVDLTSDPAHCDGCDQACNTEEVCSSGVCSSDCGSLKSCDGACVDTLTNDNHCGGCDETCGEGKTCDGGKCVCSGTTVSLSNDVQPIFTQSCATNGCHSGMRPSEGLSLESGKAYTQLVGIEASQCLGASSRLRVEAGEPDSSYLMDKLFGRDLCSGSQMPKSNTRLPTDELETIAAWICQGAADN